MTQVLSSPASGGTTAGGGIDQLFRFGGADGIPEFLVPADAADAAAHAAAFDKIVEFVKRNRARPSS